MPPLIVLFTNRVGAVILAESGLSFLGFGVPPPAPTWGGMLSGSGRAYMYQGPWLALAPGLCLTIVVYSIAMFGDALRDLLDPRMRGSFSKETRHEAPDDRPDRIVVRYWPRMPKPRCRNPAAR